MVGALNPFDSERNPLSDTYTHCCQSALGLSFLQLMNSRQNQASATHAQRMAKGNRSTVWIYVRCIVGETELSQAGKRLAGEGFIQLDEIKVCDGEFEPCEKFFG